MTICWHPEERSIIASGGRDRLIKVRIFSSLLRATLESGVFTHNYARADLGFESKSHESQTLDTNDSIRRSPAVATLISHANRIQCLSRRLSDTSLVCAWVCLGAFLPYLANEADYLSI